MSEDFFDKYNALNTSGDNADTPADSGEYADSFEAADVTAESSESVADTAEAHEAEDAYTQYSQPEQYHTAEPYYAQPVNYTQPDYNQAYASQPTVEPYTNPYSSYSYGMPVNSVPAASYDAQPSQPNAPVQPTQSYRPANIYVDSDGYYHRSFTEHRTNNTNSASHTSQTRVKKEKSGISKAAVAVVLVLCVLLSGVGGFVGSLIYNNVKSTGSSGSTYSSVSDELVIHRVSVEDSTESGSTLVDKDTDEIVTEVADSVVEITTEIVQTNSFYGQYIAQGAGSGVIISEDGYIVTNNHVIEGASNITVSLRSGESYEAKLIGTDADEDIALLKIEATGLTMAIFGDSDTLKVGDKSVIIGNPLGTLGGSVTEGILSALDRSIVIDGKTMHLMQTDAAINPGNSGGGMFNGQGELVGIVVAKSGSSSSSTTIDNIGFVIPINNVLNILGDLKQYGYVRGKADTGMSFVDINNQMYAWYYFGSSNTGVYISSVEHGSNAAEAGFSTGDRVISIDGQSVSSSSDITSIISQHSAGDTITFELERSGRTGTIDLTLEEYVPDSNSLFGSNY